MKIKTFQRISAQKSKELERVSQETLRLRGVLDEKEKRIAQLDSATHSQRQRAERAEEEREKIAKSLDKLGEERNFLQKELSGYVLRNPTDPFWKDYPVDALRILKKNFVDGKLAEGAIQGHQQIPCKCGSCQLHFIVLTWFPDRHDGKGFYCPECGEQTTGEMGRKLVPWEIGQACVQAGAPPISKKKLDRFRRRTITGGVPVKSLVEKQK